MADLIKTTSGNTPKARIAALRAMREPTTEEKLAQALNALDSLVRELYAELIAMRKQQNARRLKLVQTMQLVKALRVKHLDVEL